jgi:hypothetical protein
VESVNFLRRVEESTTRRSFSLGMGDVGAFELWWRDQVPRLTRAYLPILAAHLGGGLHEDAPAVRFWMARVLPALRTMAVSTVREYEQHLGSSVALAGIDVVTGTVAAANHERSRAG